MGSLKNAKMHTFGRCKKKKALKISLLQQISWCVPNEIYYDAFMGIGNEKRNN